MKPQKVTEGHKEDFAPALADLERRVQQALDGRGVLDLEVIGYGDSSVVLACEVGHNKFACKRLPLFPSRSDLSHYSDLLARYVSELRSRGISTLETHLQPVSFEESGCVAYCVQPAIDRQALLPHQLATCSKSVAESLFDQLLDIVLSVVSERVGLDADVSNWCLRDGQLTLIDVTTPMLRDERMNEELKLDMFLASLPWMARSVLKRVGAQALIGKFYSPRGILLDMLCGLYREGIERHVPYFMARANEAVSPPLSVRELRRYCLLNETIWSGKRKLQQIERLWRVRVLGKTYPFLLPPKGAFAGRLKVVPQLK